MIAVTWKPVGIDFWVFGLVSFLVETGFHGIGIFIAEVSVEGSTLILLIEINWFVKKSWSFSVWNFRMLIVFFLENYDITF